MKANTDDTEERVAVHPKGHISRSVRPFHRNVTFSTAGVGSSSPAVSAASSTTCGFLSMDSLLGLMEMASTKCLRYSWRS